MMLKIKNIVSLILSCSFLISVSNAMDDKQSSSDDIAMQHTISNIVRIMENTKDSASNSSVNSIAGISVDEMRTIFKIDKYNDSPKGKARKFLNDIIDVLVNCPCVDVNVNGLASNEHYKELKSVFNEMVKTDYSNLSNTKNKMFAILKQSREIFFNICKIVKNENTKEYDFINCNCVSEDDYRNLQFKLGRTLLKKTLSNTEWNSNEILLHRSLLLVIYCEKLIMDLTLFPKNFHDIDSIMDGYWNMIFNNFEFNASQYFK